MNSWEGVLERHIHSTSRRVWVGVFKSEYVLRQREGTNRWEGVVQAGAHGDNTVPSRCQRYSWTAEGLLSSEGSGRHRIPGRTNVFRARLLCSTPESTVGNGGRRS